MTHEPAGLLDDIEAAGRAIARWLGDIYERRAELATTDRGSAAARRPEAKSPPEGSKR
jgi:hypothetical protein